jgi:glucose-6-phosphate 1-dehydrogenase
VVFGATGDLTKRKLIPALYHRFKDGQFDEQSRIIGVSRSKLSDADFQKLARESIETFVEKSYQDKKTIDRFIGTFSYVPNDVTDEAHWGDLSKNLREDPKVVRAFYLAIAPDLFGPTCEYILKKGYYRRDARVVIEKPLGHDLASSIEINDEVSKIFREDQVYRIDHYLGKETVQNLLALRFANILFEPIWNSAHIDHVQITVAESVGAGTRGYYDESGALRDMVQNHMHAAAVPRRHGAAGLRCRQRAARRKAQGAALAAPITGGDVSREYGARPVSRRQRRRHRRRQLPGRAARGQAGSRTETFVALKAEVENWRWSGVPFYFRTGKRMASRAPRKSCIQFKPIPHSIFDHAEGRPRPTGSSSACSPTRASS